MYKDGAGAAEDPVSSSRSLLQLLPRYTNTLPIINDELNYAEKSGQKPKGNKLRNFYLPFGALFLKILTLVTILKDRQQITLYI